MNGLYQHYIIDLSSDNNFVQIPTVQGDGNHIRGFEVELIQNNVQYDIDRHDTLIYIMGRKPDTCHIMNDCNLTDEGYILIDITSQMSAVAGRGDYQIVLMSKSTNSQLKSFPFHILTSPATFDIDYIVSTDEFQAFTNTIIKNEVVINEAEGAIRDIRELENDVKESESDRNNAENIRIANENKRKSNEELRNTAETGRDSAEAIRIANENQRKINESTRQTNESTRQIDTADVIDKANKAIDRANKAAKACEDLKLGILPVYEIVSTTEPTGQAVNEFWLQEYDDPSDRSPVFEIVSSTEPTTQLTGDSWLQEY